MTLRERLRPTIIDRYLVREMLPPTLLGLVLFTFILLLHSIAVLTGFLVSRSASLGTILRVFATLLPNILALTIPMAFLLGVLLSFGRMASESEIVAFRAGGVSPMRLVRPVLFLALVAAVPTFYITAVGYPRANQSYRELSLSLIMGQARTTLRPRVFVDDLLPSGDMVLYVSDIISSTGEWRDLLLRDLRESQKPRLILARRGRLVVERERRIARLELHDGTIYAFDPQDPSLFEAHGFQARDISLPSSEIFPAKVAVSRGPRELTLDEVAQRFHQLRAQRAPQHEIDRMRIEWHKRFAIPVACFVLGLTGVGLSFGRRKEAKSAAFGAAIGLLLVYYVFLRLGQQFGENGMLHPVVAIWLANVVFGGLALALLVQSQREAAFDPLDFNAYARWLPRLPRRTSTAQERVLDRPRPVRLWSILDGYVARQYVGLLLLATSAFWSLGSLFEFMDLVDDVQQNHVGWSRLVHYLLFQAPFHLTLVLPVAFLVATLTTLGILARRNEITAMKAGGVSLYRLAVPVLVVAMSGSVFLFALGDYVVPFTNLVARRDHDVIKGRPTQSVRQAEERMVLGGDSRFYEFSGQEQSAGVLDSLRVYDVDPGSWSLREALFASQARWNSAGYYDLEKGWRRSLAPQPAFRSFDATRTREIEPPGYFTREFASADTLRFEELREHIRNLAAKGMDVVRLRVDLQLKLALPVVAIVMALLGIPFAFSVGRHGALHGIAISLLLAILYWICFRIFEALGRNGFLPPELAMWAPNALFAAAAVYLLLCVDT